ncbi:MAG TPA: tRNA (adenosine(37)-N6)-threonylcarbamoyltransferase complex transferase subunit TsaD [Candidatus Babeliales bacterium]|nr:tRNA (adenosine(37)-N6)-threonylcarbamoyltransferase complex transferase subunit TsaD [Candidatus Babeliales bacterium]
MRKNWRILGIESSCDETAAAVYTTERGCLANELFSQIELQKSFGGVVPELASRSHLEKINEIVGIALTKAQLSLAEIDAIAITHKPGLPGSLLIGLCFGKALAYAQNKPLMGVNHLEGHAFSSFLDATPPFPHLCITASGGHSSLYLITGYGAYQTIGQTLDDAAGEAFDKIAKFIGLAYPGGPIIEQLARAANFQDFFHYPRGPKDTLNFSFSGLKTAVLYDLVQRQLFDLKTKALLAPLTPELQMQIASSLLKCVRDIFCQKIMLALQQYPYIKAVTFVGGVACNKYLKQELRTLCESRQIQFFSPAGQYCTDNAAMIALVGHYQAQQGRWADLSLDIF